MHRAVAKQQLLDQFALRSQQQPRPLANNELVYTPVQVTGYYDKAHPILLDNRILNHQVGYDVLIPFIPADGKPAILINMGWIPKSIDQRAPETGPVIPRGAVRDDKIAGPNDSLTSVIGLVQFPEHNLVLAHPKTELRWPLLVEDIRIPELSQALNRPLYPFTLLLSGTGGFTHHWAIVTSVTPARHRGYAVQWFALALTLIIIYFKLNIRRSADE